MKVKKCPDDCVLNWIAFHQLLDRALAHYLQERWDDEKENGIGGMPPLPSTTSIMELLTYSAQKATLQKEGEKN